MKRFVPLLLTLLMMAACSAPQTPDATESTTIATTNATVQTTAASVTTAATTTATSQITMATTTVTTTPAATEVTTEPLPTYSLPLSAEDAAALVLQTVPNWIVKDVVTAGKYYYVLAQDTVPLTAMECETCSVWIQPVVIETGKLCQIPQPFEKLSIAYYGVDGDELIVWQHSVNSYYEGAKELPRYGKLYVREQYGAPTLMLQNCVNEYSAFDFSWIPIEYSNDYGYPLWRTEDDLPVGILYDCNAGYDDLSLCFGYDADMMPGDERPKVPLMSIDYENGMMTLTFDELQNRIVSDGDLGLSNRFIESVSYKTVGDGAVITLKLTEEAQFYTVDLRMVRNSDAEQEKHEKYQQESYELGNYCMLFSLRFVHDCSYQSFPAEMIQFCTAE
ncbi:MAG: hypothetical protein E7452_00295 [Ruminococcaceae bacterium]|nr:hypothetical protein [Oscillospiraceae bacterium]